MATWLKENNDVHIKFGDMRQRLFNFLWYRDEIKAKDIDADYDVRLS